MIYFSYPLAVLLIFPIIFFIIYYIRPEGFRNILLVISKSIITFIILLSIASPYTVEERPGMIGSTDITIIADNTESMRVFNSGIQDEVYDYLTNRTPTDIDFISGTRSPIGDHIVRNIRSGGNILLISDGNNNNGRDLPDAINFARSLNVTVYSLIQEPVKKDLSVSIDSDSAAILGAPFDLYIDINNIGELDGDLEVRVDNMVVYTGHVTGPKRIPITYSFNAPGSHTIKAELFTGRDDEISQNNVFYRSVHVIPRPRILLVSGGSSPLYQILSQLYSVDITSHLTDPGSYKAVVLDDVPIDGLSDADAALLSDYTAGGGGLIVVGGPHAYTDYSKRPLFEQLLPVKAGGAPLPGKSAGIVLVLDISGSTGDLSGTDPKLGIEKGLAIQMLGSTGGDDFLGVIAFNRDPHIIVPFARHQDRSAIKDTIAELRYGGTTHLSPALQAAHDMIKDFDGGRNIIVISDGLADDGDSALKAAGGMADEGITVYAIGVGGDTDEGFMKRLAAAGGGGYLRRDQTRGIELLFGEIKTREKRDGFTLLIINSGHFITKDMTLNATVYGYNSVFTRQNAQTLIMTANGNPIISTWMFGLGRVVSITADNGNMWASALYDKENSRIISASTNYAIGSPQGFEIQAQDGETGKPIEVSVRSYDEPDLRFDGEKLQFSRTGERLYSASITPDSTGFHDLSGYTIAVNEPSEYRELGSNELISEIIVASGGRAYNVSEIGRLIPDIRNKRAGVAHETVDLRPLFLFAALMLYSAEVILRRLHEILR